MKNTIRNYGFLSLALLTALPASAMMRSGKEPHSAFAQATNAACAHPFYTATFVGASAAAGFYFYNPSKAKELARKATGSGVANSMVTGAALGTGAGFLSRYMESKQLPFSTLIPLIAGAVLYESSQKFMDDNKIPYEDVLMWLTAIGTWSKPDWFQHKNP